MTTMSTIPSPKTQTMHRLYLKRRDQRVNAIKKVIKQWHILEGAEKFFDTLEVWRSATEEDSCVPDELFDLVTDAIHAEECQLDVAVDELAAANKRVYEAIDAMGDRSLYADRPSAPIETFGECFSTKKTRWPLVFYEPPSNEEPKPVVKAPDGKYDSEQVRNIVRKVAANPNLARKAACGVLDQVEGGAKSVSCLKPENLDKVYEACQSLLDSAALRRSEA